MKNKKSALLMSFTSLLICFAMLVGSTFAWFTDTTTTGVNQIVSGKLRVDIVDKDGESLKNKSLTWQKAAGAGNETVLWEPGCTYNLQSFRIVNEGNLALKYKIVISGITGDAKLLEALKFTVKVGEEKPEEISELEGELLPKDETAGNSGMSELITITGKMDPQSGNEYQGLSVENLSVTVYATQLAHEYDSIDNTYDTKATYLNMETDAEGNITAYLISNADELVLFARTVNMGETAYSGKTVKLMQDIDLGGRAWTPITANTNLIFDGNGKTISNFTASGQKNVGFFGTATNCTIKNLTITDVTVTGINHVAAIAGDALCATIENCHVKDAKITTAVKNNDDGDKAGAIAGYLSAESNASVKDCTAESCTIQGYRDIGGLVGYANAAAVITGNKVANSTIINDRTNNYKNYTADTEFDVNAIVGEYNNNTLDDSNTAENVNISTIKPANTQEKLDETLENATTGTTVAVASGSYNLPDAVKEGVTILGSGAENTTLNASNIKIASNDVTIKDVTIKGSGSAGTGGTMNINGNNTTIENVDYQGDGNIAIAVSTGKANSGTVFKNTKITNAFRGIQFWSLSGDSVIDNCVLDVAGYTFNIDAAVAGSTLTIQDSTLNGWTSYTSGIKLVSFENCKLGLNASQYLRPYSETTLTNCEFTSAGYQLNAGGSGAYTITLTNCTKNGTPITAENVKSLLLDMDDWNTNATLVVNGTTVTLN